MKYIKRINEMFNDLEMKKSLLIPYLSGDLKDKVKDWNFFKLSKDESNTDSFLNKILMRHPIIGEFFVYKTSIEEGVKFISLVYLGKSYEPNINFAYDPKTKRYFITTILRKAGDDNDKNWNIDENVYDNINDCYDHVSKFLNKCVEKKIIRMEQKWSPGLN
jgi:hypothetical protein